MRKMDSIGPTIPAPAMITLGPAASAADIFRRLKLVVRRETIHVIWEVPVLRDLLPFEEYPSVSHQVASASEYNAG